MGACAGADTLLGPEMRSTGEVMGIDRTFAKAYAKAAIAAGQKLPSSGNVFITMVDKHKQDVLPIAKKLVVRFSPSLHASMLGGISSYAHTINLVWWLRKVHLMCAEALANEALATLMHKWELDARLGRQKCKKLSKLGRVKVIGSKAFFQVWALVGHVYCVIISSPISLDLSQVCAIQESSRLALWGIFLNRH